MIILASSQVAAEYGVVVAQDAVRSLDALFRDGKDFLGDNPLMVVALVVLAVFFFAATRPKVR
jgi:hypothetical protein